MIITGKCALTFTQYSRIFSGWDVLTGFSPLYELNQENKNNRSLTIFKSENKLSKWIFSHELCTDD